MLLLIALMTCCTFGYWQRKRFWLVAVVSPLMIAIVMGLIADLDSVDLRSLERLERDLRSLDFEKSTTDQAKVIEWLSKSLPTPWPRSKACLTRSLPRFWRSLAPGQTKATLSI
jgi:hypothetical protein